MRIIILFILTFLLSACQSSPVLAPTQPLEVSSPTYAPLATLMSTQKNACSHNSELPAHFEQYQQINTFFTDWCNTRSTTTQLRLLKQFKRSHNWPDEYRVYFDSLKFNTQRLRKQRLANIKLRKALEKEKQQLSVTQNALAELKRQLALIELRHLNATQTDNNANSIEE
ncbi:hypothetical protein J8M01_07910 [Pseudoalteromonas sp. MMG005]|nr:hypothetical protein [Pseudoalteromonas sp. MMG005]